MCVYIYIPKYGMDMVSDGLGENLMWVVLCSECGTLGPIFSTSFPSLGGMPTWSSHSAVIFIYLLLFFLNFFTFTGIIPWRTLSKEDDLTLVIDLSIMP